MTWGRTAATAGRANMAEGSAPAVRAAGVTKRLRFMGRSITYSCDVSPDV
jgi:hypothetical protein